MATKNLSSLMSGIIGEAKPAQAADNADEMQDNIESRRRKNVGRPRKHATPGKAVEIRATLIVDSDVMRKIKYISLIEGTLIKDVINTALTDYINAWQSANAPIRLPKK